MIVTESLRGSRVAEFQTSGGLLNARQVIELTSLSRSTIWRAVRAGTFPAPIRISTRRIGWHRETVLSWLASLEAGQLLHTNDA